MLQGIVLSFQHGEQITAASQMRSGQSLSLLAHPPLTAFPSAADGSRTHTFLEGHHTGISIPLKYSEPEDGSDQREER
jgi:hypothetical protein